MKKQVAAWIEKTPLKEMREVFLALIRRVHEHRKANNGLVPLEIFEPCLGMSGVSTSVQIVNEVVDENNKRVGFAMKKREASEASWSDLYHSTCCTFRMSDTPESSLGRNTKESFKKNPEETLEFLGVTVHDEPERWSACVTIMHRRKVSAADVSKLVGAWKIFTEEDIRNRNPEIVGHNWYLLEWVMDENRRKFADVRGGYRK